MKKINLEEEKIKYSIRHLESPIFIPEDEEQSLIA